MALIEAKNVSLGYDGTDVVTGLTFNVNKGDYLCVVGENGSGKSTLIKALLGLKKCSSGHLHFLEGLKQNQIGYLPQQTVSQKDFPASVYEVVLSGTLGKKNLFGFYSARDKRKALDNMSMLGISELKNKCYRNLSGGQQQRALLARALCATDTLLLLDEPVTGLDPKAAEELYSLLYHLNKEHKITIIMVSHDIRASLEYSTHILHLKGDRFFFGTAEEYRSSETGINFFGGENK
ncbi:MAG: metal ABC transporter ATP-binding protein [Ruminococcaceae bacterium]|nr:metal ABC transporter ATP-binding protein [Oscillospiraceae bacterium]